MKAFPLSTFVVAFLVGLSGCDRASKDSNPPAKAASSNKPRITQSTLPMLPPITENKGTQEQQAPAPIEQLTPKVQGARTGVHGRAAIVAMHQLLEQWSPNGKRVVEVKAMLGAPSEEDAGKLVYRFDDGDQAYEWTLTVEGGTIKSLAKALHE